MSAQTILIVEDEIKIANLLRDYLEKAGYQTVCLEQGDAAVPYVKQTPPALILLDIQLPGKDGMAVCREVRQFSTVPIMMLTARVEEIDRLLGLELGADDYICKPFSPREVVARVKAILRRIQPTSVTEEKLVLGEITVDVKSHQVTIANQPLKLTPNEFALLAFFISHPNQVFSRQVLISQVQNYAFSGYERTIDSHIKNLRKKIATFLPDHEIISTVYRVGYKLNFPFSE
ncbi:MAG: two-component system response regulator BaeR [Candidatus Parabeggiatoa sp. nov. 2]|nr:MAG: two-component system response regulator BaeR [Gammaproteobacteria bacterium]